MKTQISLRLSPATLRKLEVLAEEYGTKTTAIEVAIERLYADHLVEAMVE